ncbi:MAG: hypothetical protein AB7U83_19670 [Vicinamibacterales bacterium]
MRHRGLTEAAAVVAGALVLTTALTWPLVPRLDRVGRVNTDDGKLSIWNVAWVADALIVAPRTLYDANIFYPARHTLAYSEANIGAGLLAVPAWGLTGNPYLAHNSVVIVAFVLAAAGAYALVRHLSQSRHAAALAAVLFAFCPYIFARTAHIQLLMTAGLPWAMLAFHRLVDRPTAIRALTLGAALVAQALSCAYYGIFAGLMVGLGTLWFAVSRGLWRSLRYWSLIGLAAAVALGLTFPFFLPYLGVQDQGFGRTLDDARMYSANGGAWLASSAWAHRWWLAAIEGFNEVLFPGVLTLTTGLGGVWLLLGRRTASSGGPMPRDVAWFYLAVGALAFWASFGPDAGLYRLLFETVPIFALLRAPARMGLITTLSLVVLGSLVTARWFAGRRRPAAWAAAAVVVAALELNMAPLSALREAPPVPEAYRQLARLPRGPLAEFPYFSRRTDYPRHAEYMLGSTYHWQPLVNGYSDFIPARFRDTAVALSYFPTREGFRILSEVGTRYVVFHLDGYSRSNRQDLIERLERYQRFLRPLVQQDDVWLYEIVDWPN